MSVKYGGSDDCRKRLDSNIHRANCHLGPPGCTIVDRNKRNDAANDLPNRIGTM